MSELTAQSTYTIQDLLGGRLSTKISTRSTRGLEYHMACPFCGGQDRFAIYPEKDNGKGTWSCRQCLGSDMPQQDIIEFVKRDQNMSFIDACEYLGIKTKNESTGKTKVDLSARPYDNLADYAAAKRVPVEVFTSKGFEDTTWQDRPAIKYPTYGKPNGHVETFYRVRFMDGEKPKYKPCETGAQPVLYGLNSAIEIAQQTESPLILTNGETSALVGQYYKVPAFCKTGGENRLPENLVAELKQKWQGEIIIALDCDHKGIEVSKAIQEQLENSIIIDLGLDEHGDIADFCAIHEHNSLKMLLQLIPAKLPTTVKEAVSYVMSIASNEVIGAGRTLTFPYKTLHHLQGLCRYMPPGKLSLIFAMSGHGKTSFVEPMMEYWQQRGNNGIFDGREFDPVEYEFRRIQRYSGQAYENFDTGKREFVERLTYTEFLGHKKWQEERRDNTPNFLRDGLQLTGNKQATVKWVENYVSGWTGSVKYPPRFAYLEDLLEWARDYIRTERAAGRYVDYMIFDYIQLYFISDNSTAFNAVQAALYKIKDFSVEMQIHAIVISQVNKSADGNQRNMNKPLSVADMNYINDAPANLTISLNIRYSESEEMDWQGNKLMQKHQLDNGMFAGMVWVLKNTMEITGQVLMQADLARYRWLDASYKITSIDLLSDKTMDEQLAEV